MAIGLSLRSYVRRELGETPIGMTEELACAAVALGLRRYPKEAFE